MIKDCNVNRYYSKEYINKPGFECFYTWKAIKANKVPEKENRPRNLLIENPFCSRIGISLSEYSFPITKIMLRKKAKGIITWRNSGYLNKITQNTKSALSSPLDTCSKYCIDLEERTIKRKTKPTATVCEKMSFNK